MLPLFEVANMINCLRVGYKFLLQKKLRYPKDDHLVKGVGTADHGLPCDRKLR
jgi:hypothetical protein